MSEPPIDNAVSAATAVPALPAIAVAPPASVARVVAAERLIDVMRGFAALLVAYYHCRQVTWIGMESFSRYHMSLTHPGAIAAWLTLPVAWGSAGVPVFFVISGYCIHRSNASRLFTNPQYRLDTREFLLRRFVRIYPALVAALVLTFVADSISLSLSPVSHKILSIGPGPFLVNLLSLQGVAGRTYGSNGALWTLSLEVQFYLFYPLVFALRRRFGMARVVAGVAVLNAVSAVLLERHQITFFPSYWLSWMLGAWIAEARIEGRKASPFAYPVAAIVAAAGCAAYHFGQFGAFQLWSIAFACFFFKALSQRWPAFVTGSPITWAMSKIGDFSYSLYLIHLPIFVLIGSLLYRSALQFSIWPSFVLTLAMLPIAWTFWFCFERPAVKVARRLRRKAA